MATQTKKDVKCCTREDMERWKEANKVLILVFAGLTFVVVIMTCVFVARQDTIFRIAFKATAADVVGGVGESGAVVNGMISMDATTNSIGYVVRTSAAMTGVTAILIRGPVQLATPQIGPIFIALCGDVPGAGTCDTLTVPGQVAGTVTSIYDGVPPEATDVRPAVEQLRANPFLYYIEILTNANPASPGSCRADIVATVGFQ